VGGGGDGGGEGGGGEGGGDGGGASVIWSSWTLESLLLATMAKLSLPRVNAAMPRAPDKEVKLPWPSVALSTDSGLSGSVTSSSSTPLSYLRRHGRYQLVPNPWG
jgi:hypothetical protein